MRLDCIDPERVDIAGCKLFFGPTWFDETENPTERGRKVMEVDKITN